MKVIDKRRINLKDAKKITKHSFESNIYVKGKKAYKMFKKIKFYNEMWRIAEKKEKVILLENSSSKQIVKPDAIILKNGKIDGLRMDYIDNLGTMYDFFSVYNGDLSKYLITAKKASSGLKEIHNDPLEIVVCDLNFYNILFDKCLNTYYVDADSYEIGKYDATSVSEGFVAYCKRRGIDPYPACQTFDRFQFMYEFLSVIFGTNIENITPYQYAAACEQLETLKNMRLCFKKIKQATKIPNLPYVCDLVADSDINPADLPIIGSTNTSNSSLQLTR